MIREWLARRYIEADYHYLETKHHYWWDWKRVDRARRKREFWASLGGRRW